MENQAPAEVTGVSRHPQHAKMKAYVKPAGRLGDLGIDQRPDYQDEGQCAHHGPAEELGPEERGHVAPKLKLPVQIASEQDGGHG